MAATTVNEKPILFSGEMVRAILDGRKAQTRRMMKPQPEHHATFPHWRWKPKGHLGKVGPFAIDHGDKPGMFAPYCAGERRWVRETWSFFGGDEYMYQRDQSQVMYRATWDEDQRKPLWKIDGKPLGDTKWRPSIFMPRRASRITLEITDVTVERLQEISSQDAWNEGCRCECTQPVPMCAGNRDVFKTLWNKINGDGSWESNPWVWAISFRRVPEGTA
jgi:hypothetical protein